MLPRGLPLLYLLVLLVSIFGAYYSGSRLMESQELVATAQAFRDSTFRSFIATLDVETSQRGYLLTGREAYLEPYYKGREVLAVEIDTMKRMRLSEDQSAFLNTVKPLVDAKMAELKRTIELRQSGDFAAAQKVVATDQGRAVMDKMRTLFFIEKLRSDKDRAALKAQVVYWTSGVIYALVSGIVAALLLFFSYKPKPKQSDASETRHIVWDDF